MYYCYDHSSAWLIYSGELKYGKANFKIMMLSITTCTLDFHILSTIPEQLFNRLCVYSLKFRIRLLRRQRKEICGWRTAQQKLMRLYLKKNKQSVIMLSVTPATWEQS
jgi:hypothetical protein